MKATHYKLHSPPARCPVCAQGTFVEKLRCLSCGTAIEGQFTLGWLQQLSAEQLGFVKVFLNCRGKIKDVEQALGLSYPTVVARLDEVVAALGEPQPNAPSEWRGVLQSLAAGEIDVDTAAERIRGEKNDGEKNGEKNKSGDKK